MTHTLTDAARKWYRFDPSKGSRQKRPLEKKPVLVARKSEGDGLPISIAVGYLRNAAGDKQSPYFVIPGLGGDAIGWCDCLGESEPKNWWLEGVNKL